MSGGSNIGEGIKSTEAVIEFLRKWIDNIALIAGKWVVSTTSTVHIPQPDA